MRVEVVSVTAAIRCAAGCPKPIRPGSKVVATVIGTYDGPAPDGGGTLTTMLLALAHLGCGGALTPEAVKEARHQMRIVVAERAMPAEQPS